MKLCDGLADNGQGGGGARAGGELFIDVEGRLVLISSLETKDSVLANVSQMMLK